MIDLSDSPKSSVGSSERSDKSKPLSKSNEPIAHNGERASLQQPTAQGLPATDFAQDGPRFVSAMETLNDHRSTEGQNDLNELSQTVILPIDETERRRSDQKSDHRNEENYVELSSASDSVLELRDSDIMFDEESSLIPLESEAGDTSHLSTKKTLQRVSSRYLELERLGEGGMGEVFSAHDRLLKRVVALKRIRGQADQRSQEAFIREARILAQLSHPSIIPIHDLSIPPIDSSGANAEEQSAFFTMEKVTGETLSAHIARFVSCPIIEGAHRLFELLNIFVSIGEAIDYAHKRGVLHRDLKPDNVMIGEYGQVKVLDWGLGGRMSHLDHGSDDSAKLHADLLKTFTAQSAKPKHFTFTGTISGTPAYMSPEQARGERLTEQTDVYALGAILYEILSGAAPYVKVFKDDPQCAWLILEQAQRAKISPPLKRESCPHPHLVNSYLIQVCERALDPALERRYPSVAELLDDLRNYLSGESLRARIKESKDRIKMLYVKTTEQLLRHQQASTLWERLKASQEIPVVAHFRSEVLHSLEDLVRWDKADLEARLWGLHLRYHYILFQWWRGELEIGYKVTCDILKSRCQQLEIFRDTPLNKEIPWAEVGVLSAQRRKVYISIESDPQELIKLTIAPIYRYDQETKDGVKSAFEDAKTLPYVHGEALNVNLPWGCYSLKVILSDKSGQERSFCQLIKVSPQVLDLFEGDDLLSSEEYLAISQKSQFRDLPLKILVKLPPSRAIFSWPKLGRSKGSSSLPILGRRLTPPPCLEDRPFEWIGRHALSIGTWQPLFRTIAPYEVEAGGLWLQRDQVTIGAYLYYLNSLDRLLRTLPQEERVRPIKDLKQILPSMNLNFLEIKDQPLFSREGPGGVFRLSEAMSQLGVNSETPMIQVSYFDIERYLMWASLETGVEWTIPSENDWELAARGVDQRTFPWGELAPDRVTQMKRSASSPFDGREQLTQGDPYILSAERRKELYPYDESPFGIEGLGGGLSDWTLNESLKSAARSKISAFLARASTRKLSELERARLLFTSPEWRSSFNESFSFGERHLNAHFLRGGSFLNENEQCTTMYRVEVYSHQRFIDVSFRLAFAPSSL